MYMFLKKDLGIGRQVTLESIPETNASTCNCLSPLHERCCNTGDLGSIPGLGKVPGEGNGYPLQYSGLENSVDCIVLGVAKSRTQLSNFHFLTSIYFYTWLLWWLRW